MHPRIFAEFNGICQRYNAGGDVLEVGAVPQPDTLLCLPSLAEARSKTGINLSDSCWYDGFQIHRIDANEMKPFEAESFDTVLCNATLEHDRFFWRSLEEIRRVARPGALIVVGVPGYAVNPAGWISKLTFHVTRFRFLKKCFGDALDGLQASTPTLVVHNFPSDYYRFSVQAMREVIMGGLDQVEVMALLKPPRLIGSGFKPG